MVSGFSQLLNENFEIFRKKRKIPLYKNTIIYYNISVIEKNTNGGKP